MCHCSWPPSGKISAVGLTLRAAGVENFSLAMSRAEEEKNLAAQW